MQFTVDSSTLLHGLQKVARVSPTRSTMPILNHILFTVKGNVLSMRSTDIEITYTLNLNVLGEDEGAVALPVRLLQEITSELPDTELTFAWSDDSRVTLSTTAGTYKIVGRPALDFPDAPELGPAQSLEIKSKVLKRTVEKTVFAVSKDELKPALLGVLFELKNNEIRAVATDGHRLVKYTNRDFVSADFEANIIVPPKFLSLIQSFLDDGDTINLSVGEKYISVATETATIFSRLIDEQYPDYGSVIPSTNDKTVTLSSKDLVTTVRRVSIFSNRTTHQVALKLHPGYIEVFTEDPEASTSAKEQVLSDYDGEELTLGYNSIYLKDMLKNVETDRVVFRLGSEIGPGLILPEVQAEKEELVMLLMPIRLQG
ncbi:MAG: DNA polymerase III subunit beta [Candidatus Marinimicrobia bacterium]|jgi:DNA polymerase-3 subunit beta|nr:DNA polymerase III subunit beta [Candidatus Neomarinimicrobiota bacterium]MBT3575668.1 DNA polymerase III subunit beta [Candidatus Neomarinimicrobiota bacterium]MBT3679849.1 DNA polymerase III subunit beta [Candidatus Neomarinimicrobiota bacterium]MBT3952065.1 DNA polymerase III subunit beta [Candidatus Neomarinimicrobiota bacterium]MBT4251956.1 DNA polymerase III subunit beta [Candidatus Neomarinimicrobiota bacterium]